MLSEELGNPVMNVDEPFTHSRGVIGGATMNPGWSTQLTKKQQWFSDPVNAGGWFQCVSTIQCLS